MRIALGLSLVMAWPAAQHAFPGGIAERWTIDDVHSSVAFTVPFMGLSRVRGNFGDFSGALILPDTDPVRGSVTAIIKTASINTGFPRRDNHLRSPDFFDAEKHPLITFQSDRVERTPTGFLAHGRFSMHGRTHEIALPFIYLEKPGADAWGNQRITFEARTTLSRKDYEIDGGNFWNSEFDPGRFVIGDRIDVELIVSVVKWKNQPVAAWDSIVASADRYGAHTTLVRLLATGPQEPPAGMPVPASANTALQIAKRLVADRGRWDPATLWLDALVAAHPNFSGAHDLRGELQVLRGDRAAAVRSYVRAAELDPAAASPVEMLRWLRRQ